EIAHLFAQALQIPRRHILRDDPAVRSDDGRQSLDVVAAARADVRNRHSRLDAEQTHELAWLAGSVTLRFVLPDRANDAADRAIRLGKSSRRRTRLRHERLRSA